MEHAHREVPEEQPAIFANRSEPIVALVTSPWVEFYVRNPGVVALTSGHERAVGKAPNGHEVVLTTGKNVSAVWRPCHGQQAAIIRNEHVD